MEELQKLVDELDERYHALEEESHDVYRKLEEAREKLALEQMKNIEHDIQYYKSKLKALKAYIDEFNREFLGSKVHYTFRKQDHPYTGDFHEVISDPLDYLMGEYDCLGMTKFLEIVFEYHNEVVKTFVQTWMKENIPYAEFYSDMKDLYNPFFSKKT